LNTDVVDAEVITFCGRNVAVYWSVPLRLDAAANIVDIQFVDVVVVAARRIQSKRRRRPTGLVKPPNKCIDRGANVTAIWLEFKTETTWSYCRKLSRIGSHSIACLAEVTKAGYPTQ